MRCPFCSTEDTQVKDSRPSDDSTVIRRRRVCGACGARFTTFERVQLRELMVVKTNGDKETFDREKLVRSMHIALRKRPIADDRIEKVVNSITRQLEALGEAEIPTKRVGELVMEALLALDHVAYVRYASVYRDFRSPTDFNEFVEMLKRQGEQG
ncbi:MAG: transcriptional repressor NrdR [Alphaproteobacteria bacterium]|nr:transcriptional repressor NrdR [Alphaproteobacteria bacterium]NDC56644.1 transcriptional repressor NrdR [Alphaproteobacteria bacterium]NDG04375.1 transcriptional repressor NrdR [Alphaproteobacteria bacterium]